eukprot:TRINITY_DN11568_c0_g1_i1.p1 TRINITY_DN11568_c0_g1~~TRINITY_DN11568_c0_g1_i1.p1  ORF type:complete len:351 (+),score=63.24 TRINITY_DN11568_c0_g1_i1:27-1055(+)
MALPAANPFKVVSEFHAQHKEYMHDVAYNFYGTRLATCSSDKYIKIWEKDEAGHWAPVYQWRKHTGSVWKLAWSHPLFGSLLASCSSDKKVMVWQEPEGSERAERKEWTLLATLVDHRDQVTDIAFSPRNFGLRIATACKDGRVRIYEANDPINLDHWELMEEFEANVSATAARPKAPGDAPAPAAPRPAVNCLSWNPSLCETLQSLVVGTDDGFVRIWQYNEQNRKWEPVLAEGMGQHKSDVHDVCWAPCLGRSYHLIASCGKDAKVFINKVRRTEVGGFAMVEVLFLPIPQPKELWRVEWDVTGTALASSGDDGLVRIWKKNPAGRWEAAELSPNTPVLQ